MNEDYYSNDNWTLLYKWWMKSLRLENTSPYKAEITSSQQETRKNHHEAEHLLISTRHFLLFSSANAQSHPAGGSSNRQDLEVWGTFWMISQVGGHPAFGGGGGGAGVGSRKSQVHALLLREFQAALAVEQASFASSQSVGPGPGPGSSSRPPPGSFCKASLRLRRHRMLGLQLDWSRKEISALLKVRKQGPSLICKTPLSKRSSLMLNGLVDTVLYICTTGFPSAGPRFRVLQTWKNSFPCWVRQSNSRSPSILFCVAYASTSRVILAYPPFEHHWNRYSYPNAVMS